MKQLRKLMDEVHTPDGPWGAGAGTANLRAFSVGYIKGQARMHTLMAMVVALADDEVDAKAAQ
eukprot:13391479-Alexandrium_andersonii.AAC.1